MTTREQLNWRGKLIEADIGAVAHGGHCVARVDGRVIFVRHTLPGERVVVKITDDKGGSYCNGDAVRIITPSPDRVAAPCPLAKPGGCGGCDWQHVTPQAQRALKAAVVAEQLHRLAGVDRDVTVEELPGGPLHWRTRMRLAVTDDGHAGLRKHHRRTVLPIDDCPIAVPAVLTGELNRRWSRDSEIELVLDSTGKQHVARLDPIPPQRGDWRTRWLAGGRAVEQAAGRRWELRADGFWQVHPAAADTFATVVRDWAMAPAGGRAWDLYGGVGLFAAVLAEQVGETGSVLLVEASKFAVADAETNLADLPQVNCVAEHVESLIEGLPDDDQPDVVVLDPPRKGAGRAVVDGIAAHSPDRVIYVACDPAALARDVALFAGHGYELADLRAFDAFPMTQHIECVAFLIR